jgi:RNA polymerase sigma-70 factor (ECF subfamily)
MKRVFANTSITHYNTNLKYYYQEDITEIKESETLHFDANEQDYSQEELLGVIESLSDGYRMVFNLFAIEGFKHKEIAEMLGIDEATSKSQFFRARKLIQKKLLELSSEKIMSQHND